MPLILISSGDLSKLIPGGGHQSFEIRVLSAINALTAIPLARKIVLPFLQLPLVGLVLRRKLNSMPFVEASYLCEIPQKLAAVLPATDDDCVSYAASVVPYHLLDTIGSIAVKRFRLP